MKNKINFKPFYNNVLKELKNANIENYSVDAKIICSYVLGVAKSSLIMVNSISKANSKKILKLVKLRKKRIPVQYLIKNVEFYNCNLFVKIGVLIPRNETEQFAEIIVSKINTLVNNNKNNKIKNGLNKETGNKTINSTKNGNKKLATNNSFTVLDLCCGSGAIGVSVAKNSSKVSSVHFADISKTAIKVTKKNIVKNNIINSKVYLSNLFNKLKNNKYSFIVSNPPYIKTNDISTLQTEVKNHEPIIALDGGYSGLEFYSEIISQARKYLNNNGILAFELGINQAQDVKQFFINNGYNEIEIIKDYSGIDRFIFAKYIKNKVIKNDRKTKNI